MDKDIKDFQCYPTRHQKDFIEQTFTQMVELIPKFSKLQRERPGLSFTEYSMLYRDLFEFFNIELMTRQSYKVKDIISFRNSFELIYRRVKQIENLEHATLHLFFLEKLRKFQEWADEIEQIAQSTLARK